MDAPRSQRIEFLDSIRGLAALAVLFSHAVGVFEAGPGMQHFLELVWLRPLIDGKAAVAMFFVLSGFVLSRPYVKLDQEGRARPLRLVPFYIKRITRIYFPFFTVLCMSAIANLWFFHRVDTVPAQTDWFKHFWSIPWTAGDFLKQCFYLLHNADQQFLIQDWSLGVELKASALLPFLLLAWRGSAWLLAGLGLVLMTMVGTGHYYFGFILGIFLATQGESLIAKIRGQHFGFKCLVLLAGLMLYNLRALANSVTDRPVPEKWIWLAVSLGCILILLASFSSRRIQKTLEHTAVVFLGRISYGVYLLQFLVLLVATPQFVHLLNRAGLQSLPLVWSLGFFFSVSVTIAGGAVFFQWVERPSMQFGHWLAARCSPKTDLKPAPVPRIPGVTR